MFGRSPHEEVRGARLDRSACRTCKRGALSDARLSCQLLQQHIQQKQGLTPSHHGGWQRA